MTKTFTLQILISFKVQFLPNQLQTYGSTGTKDNNGLIYVGKRDVNSQLTAWMMELAGQIQTFIYLGLIALIEARIHVFLSKQ